MEPTQLWVIKFNDGSILFSPRAIELIAQLGPMWEGERVKVINKNKVIISLGEEVFSLTNAKSELDLSLINRKGKIRVMKVEYDDLSQAYDKLERTGKIKIAVAALIPSIIAGLELYLLLKK